ncbi:MAG: hypothetical protein H7270_04920 [Dermatophilaceae bacterium]|nr:hypothetical protein [Dermatophilaceae bacterium]
MILKDVVPPGSVVVVAVQPAVRISLDVAEAVEAAGLFVTPTFTQAAPFAEQLGLDLFSSGA